MRNAKLHFLAKMLLLFDTIISIFKKKSFYNLLLREELTSNLDLTRFILIFQTIPYTAKTL